MSNSNDETPNSSNVSSNPPPSNSVEPPINDPTTNLENIDANKASTLTTILCENQINICVNQAKTASDETTNQNAGTSSTSPQSRNNDDPIITQDSINQNSNNDSESQGTTPSDIEDVTTLTNYSAGLPQRPSLTENSLAHNSLDPPRLGTFGRVSPDFFRNPPNSTADYIRPTPSVPMLTRSRLVPTLIIIRRHGSRRDEVRVSRSATNLPPYQSVDPATNPPEPGTDTTHQDVDPPTAIRVIRSDSTISPQENADAGVITTISDTQSPESDVGINITPSPIAPYVIHGPPPIAGAPPTYSAVMRVGTDTIATAGSIRIQPSPPFIAPVPPPPYTEMQDIHTERPMLVASADQMIWGPDPISVVCPRCGNVVVTSTESQRSNLTHFSALALCLCLCWPCCLLPYCMDSCKNTYHHCPNCQQFLGMYRPW